MELIKHYLRPYVKRMILGMSFKMAGTVMELLLPGLLAYILDTLIPARNRNGVFVYGALMILCALLAWVGNVGANRAAASVARDSIRTLRHDLFGKITRLRASEIDRFTPPSLISRMSTDTYYVYRMIGMMQRIGIRAPILLLGGIIITMTLDAALSGLLLALMPLMGLTVYLISRRGVPLFTRSQEHIDRLTRIVRENLTGSRIIRALCKTGDEKARFRAANDEAARSEVLAASTMAVNGPIMSLILNLGLVLVVFVGARRVDGHQTEPGVIIAFLSYFTIILNAMLTITRILTMYSKALASAGRIREVMDAAEEEEAGKAEGIPGAPAVQFDHVSFAYNKQTGQKDVSDLCFTLEKGQHLGILGPTGSGKSTLIRLLLRLYDADEGTVYVDGRDVRDLSMSSLRSGIGVVFQNDTVFRGTLGDNVTLGRKVSLEEVERALRDAQAEGFVTEKGGVDGAVVSRGHNLSGGQQQRLMIARALLGGRKILILDDATSALDYRTEAALRGRLREYRDSTVIMIAQRISAVMHCDKILVMEDGEIRGQGTHHELMRDCALYREIAALQLGGEDGQ